MIAQLAWLVWNPNRVLFTIPLIDRPVMVYGFCFVIGFMIGYFIVAWMLKEKIEQTKILERDVANWPHLIQALQKALADPEGKLSKNFNRKITQEVMNYHGHGNVSETLKKEILKGLNESALSKETFEKYLPGAINSPRDLSYILTDRITWYIVLGTVIGARLGHVLFYDLPRYLQNPIEVFKIWEGGLASHGGVLGVLIAVYLYHRIELKKFPEISLIGLIDCLVIPSGLVAFFIRIGNFFNQEIVGPETNVPWAVIFVDPMEGGGGVPRHPTQLYEAGAYLAIFILLLYLWNTTNLREKPGFFTGIFMVLLFGARFFIEFVKLPQSLIINESFLQMGQYLSIPFIIFGLALLIWSPQRENA